MRNSEERRQMMKRKLPFLNVSFQQSQLLVRVQEIHSLGRVPQTETMSLI